MIDIKVKRLHGNASVPTKAHDVDAGWDFYWCPKNGNQVVPYHFSGNKTWCKLETGISMSIPEGYCLVLFGRSGLASKHGISVIGGVIDSGYTGEISVMLEVPTEEEDVTINGEKCFRIHYPAKDVFKPGFKCAQGLILPVPKVNMVLVDDIENTQRGQNGFGSSDNPRVIKGS